MRIHKNGCCEPLDFDSTDPLEESVWLGWFLKRFYLHSYAICDKHQNSMGTFIGTCGHACSFPLRYVENSYTSTPGIGKKSKDIMCCTCTKIKGIDPLFAHSLEHAKKYFLYVTRFVRK